MGDRMMKKMPKGMKKGGKLEMVEKDGKMVPFFAADGEGKMQSGGMVPKTKGYFKGGRTMTPSDVGTPVPYTPRPGPKGGRGSKGRGGRG